MTLAWDLSVHLAYGAAPEPCSGSWPASLIVTSISGTVSAWLPRRQAPYRTLAVTGGCM